MENNLKVFKTHSEVIESLNRIESFLDDVRTHMNDIRTFGVGMLKFFDENVRIINEVQAALLWVIDSLLNNTERELIDNVKSTCGRIYEKMKSINELITDNACNHTNKWLYILEHPTVTGIYNATIKTSSTGSVEYKVMQAYYDLNTKKWYITGDTNDLIIMWFKNY